MEPDQFADMVVRIRDMEKALGSLKKLSQRSPRPSSSSVVELCIAVHTEGEVIGNRIIELRPALGIYPKYKEQVAKLRADKDIREGEAIFWTHSRIS